MSKKRGNKNAPNDGVNIVEVSESINSLLNIEDNSNDILFIENINLTTLKNMEYDNQDFNIDNDNANVLEELNYNHVESYNKENFSKENCIYNNNNINDNTSDRMKDKFYSYEEWYNNTILCWYCGNNFNNKPIFIPKRISFTNLDVMGNFCSFSCSCKYINLYYKGNDNLRSNYINNLKYLYKIFNNKEVNIIPESPDKEIMKKYGGFMTENEYKEAIKKLKYI